MKQLYNIQLSLLLLLLLEVATKIGYSIKGIKSQNETDIKGISQDLF